MATQAEAAGAAATDKERAIRLIRKLDARTQQNGCTEHEALEAADKIGELLEQFDIELTEVIISEERCVQREVYAADEYSSAIVSGISTLCGLMHYRDLDKPSPITYVLFGMERDMELAVYLYEICAFAAEDEWAAHVNGGLGHTRKERESFRQGFSNRLWARMKTLKAQRDQHREDRLRATTGRDLVLVREGVVQEEFQKTGVRLVDGKSRRVHNAAAYHRGAAAAETINLNSPLEGPEDTGLIR